MRFGFQLPTGREGLSLPAPFFQPVDFIDYAITAESLGYDSLWGNDHLTSPNYVREAPGPKPNLYELLTVLTAAAAVTHKIQLGTAALILSMRDLVTTARQVATLDQLSGGRLLLGVGLGNYMEERAAAYPGRAKANRRAMLEEALTLLDRLFTEDDVTFEGKYFQTRHLDLNPKPVQKPFPILIGGHHHNSIDRTIRFGQGWIPGWEPFDEMKENISQLREKATLAGRDPSSILVAPHLTVLVARTQEEAEERYLQSGVVRHRLSMGYSKEKILRAVRYNLIGSPENILGKVECLQDIGVDHLASLSFAVDTVGEFGEQMHFFAEEVMQPYQKARRPIEN